MNKNALIITTTARSLVVMLTSRELQQLTALDEPANAQVTRYYTLRHNANNYNKCKQEA